MRKCLICVLMTTLLLAGCGPAGVSEAEELALTIRGEYLAMESCAARAAVTADYGQRVYQYEMAVSNHRTVSVPAPGVPEGSPQSTRTTAPSSSRAQAVM